MFVSLIAADTIGALAKTVVSDRATSSRSPRDLSPLSRTPVPLFTYTGHDEVIACFFFHEGAETSGQLWARLGFSVGCEGVAGFDLLVRQSPAKRGEPTEE